MRFLFFYYNEYYYTYYYNYTNRYYINSIFIIIIFKIFMLFTYFIRRNILSDEIVKDLDGSVLIELVEEVSVEDKEVVE